MSPYPTWSPDGEWIAYFQEKAYSAVHPSGEGRKKLFPQPRALTGYGHDAGVTLHALDNVGVGIDRKHFVPAIPEFFEHGIGSHVRMSRNASYRKALSLKEPRN